MTFLPFKAKDRAGRLVLDGTADVPGGSSPGVVRTYRIPFTFATPNLTTGAALYTPTPDDLLHDAYLEIVTAWNGTTPFGDFAIHPADTTNNGIIQQLNGFACDMTAADKQTTSLKGIRFSDNASLASITGSQNERYAPSPFINADPILVCVTQDGTFGGSDPVASHGAGALVVKVSTPALP